MSALVFGALTALMWTNSNLCSSRAVRSIPEYSVVAWITFVGLLITAPFALNQGVPAGLTAGRILGLTVVGVATVVGLVLLYSAFKVGKVAVVAPIAASEGAVAALISAVTGETLAPAVGLLLLGVVCGVGLSVVAPDPAPIPHEQPVRAALLATAAAGCFGIGLYLSGRFSTDLPLPWVLMVPRIVGTLVLFVPLLVTGRLRITRYAAPLVIATGFSEVLGYLALGLGAATSIATTTVMASQTATFSALGGRILFKERLGRIQIAGIAVLVCAVTGLAIVSTA